MPLIPIQLQPGVDAQSTPALGPTGWNESRNIRFFQGLAQKTGGFKKFFQAIISPTDPILGRSAVALKAWATLSSAILLAAAGENRVTLFAADSVFDLTPLTGDALVPIALSTGAGGPTVNITDLVNRPAAGDWIRFRAPAWVGGLVLDGSYEVMRIVDASHYTITAAVNATGSIHDGGAVRVFSTTAGSTTVVVTLSGPDTTQLTPDEVIRVTDPVLVGGITVEGNYVATLVDQFSFLITLAAPALTTDSVQENGGNIALTFFQPAAGVQRALEVEDVTLDTWGEFLVIIPQDMPVFIWQPALGNTTPAANVLTAPQANTSGFVSTQQQILVLCGTVNFATGLFDPMLVRWSDVGDYTVFTPLGSNQSGSFRLSLGSGIVAGLSVAGRGLIWTDLGLYSMQYENVPLVWGFQPIGVNTGLIGPKAMAVIGETVVWMSQQFYVLAGGGSPQIIPCSVWDLVFPNIDKANAREATCATNAFFTEVAWYVPQNDGTTTKARLNIASGTWDYTIIAAGDTSDRSAAIDQNVFGSPFGASPDGTVYREETGTDADDQPLPWRMVTGIAQIAQGDQVAFFREIIPDFKFSNTQFAGPGTVKMLVYVYRNPQSAPRIKGPYLINARTRSVPCRGRGRGLQFEFSGDDLGSSPRLGLISYRAQSDGRGG